MNRRSNSKLLFAAIALGCLGFGGSAFAATPIEIPYVDPDAPMLGPRGCAACFHKEPITITGRVTRGKVGRFLYKRDEEGTIVGQTPHGYAKFRSLGQYQRYLRRAGSVEGVEPLPLPGAQRPGDLGRRGVEPLPMPGAK